MTRAEAPLRLSRSKDGGRDYVQSKRSKDGLCPSNVILVRDASTGEVICRVAAQCALFPAGDTVPVIPSLPSGRNFQEPGKPVDEVLEVVRDLTGCEHAVLMDGPDAATALAYTRSDHILPGMYYFHRKGATKAAKQPQPPSWRRRVASVIVALFVLGAAMQSMILVLGLPVCGWNGKCLYAWFRTFIGHIDGPFKVFTFVAAIERAAANPSIWLDGIQKFSRGVSRILKVDTAERNAAAPKQGREEQVGMHMKKL